MDARVEELIRTASEADLERLRFLVFTGIQHEQQHQELLVTEVKHILGCNVPGLREPYRPRRRRPRTAPSRQPRWVSFEGGLHEFGNVEGGWCWDNEMPVHKAWLDGFSLMNRLVTNAEYLEFMEDGGYRNPLLWLSNGWAKVQEQGWTRASLLGERTGRQLAESGRSRGDRDLDPDEPVCHVSFYEADAFARWKGARLPTEREWEHAARVSGFPGKRLELPRQRRPPSPARDANGAGDGPLLQMGGDLWEWTTEPLRALPRLPAVRRPPDGVQRQVHGQRARAARRLLRHAGEPHPRQLPQLLGGRHPVPVHRNPAGPSERQTASDAPEVAILGGGVMGASVAWHLACARLPRRGGARPRAFPGAGSTGRATGGFRAQFATEVNIRMSLLSREKLLRFPEEVGTDSGYRPRGYLFLAADEEQMAALRSIRPLQRAEGVPVEEVGPEDIRRLNPAVGSTASPAARSAPSTASSVRSSILNGYAEAARRLGVRFEMGTEVTGFFVEKRLPGRVLRVETSSGPIAARHVVNAAGAWAAELARPGRRRHPGLARAPADRPHGPHRSVLPEDMPMTIFLEDGFHLRVRDGRVLLLWPRTSPRTDPFDSSFDESWLDGLLARAHARVPCLRGRARGPRRLLGRALRDVAGQARPPRAGRPASRTSG